MPDVTDESERKRKTVSTLIIPDVRVELKHMGFLAAKADKGSAHQSAKCGLFSGQRAGNSSPRVNKDGGEAVGPR